MCSAPRTKVMCGVELMNIDSADSFACCASPAQNSREIWNCSFTFTALEMSIEPSGR